MWNGTEPVGSHPKVCVCVSGAVWREGEGQKSSQLVTELLLNQFVICAKEKRATAC